MKKCLGKIIDVKFGLVGYQECNLGIALLFYFDGSEGYKMKGFWDSNCVKWDSDCKWTEEDRSKHFDETMRYISDLLFKSKVDDVYKLKGIPVEVEVEENIVKSFRILEEVL